MLHIPDIKTQIIKISQDYFDYMARNYPVMCLSDEFYFFPRAKKGARFLNFLDSLDEQKIKQDISCIKNLKSSLGKLNSKGLGLEARIDLALLNQSMSTYLREFDELKIWQTDPSLYLKILLLGVDQILSRFSYIKADIYDSLMSRIAQIPRLLNEARDNLKKIPFAYLEIAIELVENSIDYFKTVTFSPENKHTFLNKHTLLKELNVLIKKSIESLEDFKRFLIKRPSSKAFIKDRQLLESIFKSSFSYVRNLEDMFEIASEEYHQTLKRLTQIAKKVKPTQTWQQILSSYRIDITGSKDLLKLYSSQIKKIRIFLEEKNVITIPRTQNIQVRFTPQFMRPLRASASYSSPVTANIREPAYFYITADFAKTNKLRTKVLAGSKPSKKRGFSNIHNEYIFITAHETYPGHHLLDSVRRRIANPIRQQIESPLFYEGWASYSERFIDQLGYINSPLQRLLGLKRQAWRAVRAMLDVGVRINKLSFFDAQKLLEGLGYAPPIVKLMLRHYALLPGYQSCYTIGKFEIDKLKEKFSAKLGIRKFHDFLLRGGQIPFDLIEERMQNQLCRKNF